MRDHPVRIALLITVGIPALVVLCMPNSRVHRWLRRGGWESPLVRWAPAVAAFVLAVGGWWFGRRTLMAVLLVASGALAIVGAVRRTWVLEALRCLRRAGRRLRAGSRILPGPPIDRRRMVWWLGFTGVLVVGGMVLFQRLHSGAGIIVGDEARFAGWSLRALRDRPLLGSPTTADLYGNQPLYQPGPIETYAMHPFVRWLGIDTGPYVFALTVNLLAVLAAAWAASMVRGRRAAVITAVAMIWMSAATMPGHVANALNVYIVVVPMFACFVLCWALAAGRSQVLPVLALAATFVIQTHVAYGFPVVLVGLVAVVLFVVASRRGGWDVALPFRLLLSGVVLVVTWYPVVYDQLFRSGNLQRFFETRLPSRGAAGAWQAVSAMFQPRLMFRLQDLSDPELRAPLRWPALLVLVTLVALIVAYRRQPRNRTLVVVTFTVIGATALTGAMVPNARQGTYHLYFVKAAFFFVLFALGTIADPVSRVPAWLRSGARLEIGGLALVAASWLVYVPVGRPGAEPSRQVEAATSLLAQLEPVLADDGTYVILSRGGIGTYLISEGLAAHLDTGNRRVLLNAPSGEDAIGLVVVEGSGNVDGSGAELATFHPSGASPAVDAMAARIRRGLRTQGSVRIEVTAAAILSTYIDGSRPELCRQAFVRDPNALLDLPAGVATMLVAEYGIEPPPQMPDANREANEWLERQPVTVRQLRPAQFRRARSDPARDPIYLSRPSCPGG